MQRRTGLMLITAILAACASTPPLNIQDIDASITPPTAVTDIDSARGKKIMWGGIIIDSRNLEKRTRLEILAYPLDDRQRPRLDREPFGRFIAEYDGYLETVDYAAGRSLSLTGTLHGITEGSIDNAVYTYPTITVDQVHLWPTPQHDKEPHFQIGIGVYMHN